MSREERGGDSSADEISLRDVLKAVKEQGDVNSQLRKEVADLRKEVHGSSVAVASQVKKLKQEQEYKWKYESNKIQFSLNSEILADLNQVIWAIENTKLDHAQETVNEIVEKVKKRNKLIKIADSSEAGWETVKQYETNPVASDTDDENRINKAENRALRKRKFKSGKKDTKRYKNNASSTQFVPNNNFPAQVPVQQQPFREPPTWYTGTPIYSGMPGTSGVTTQRFQHGACYSCGSMSHWRNKCPHNGKGDGKPKAE